MVTMIFYLNGATQTAPVITFASLDTSTGRVSLSDRKLYGKDLLNAILGVYVMLGLIESAMETLDSLIRTIAQVHSAAHPV